MKKGSGWRGESHRHRLAGMGIKTSKIKSKSDFNQSNFYVSSRKLTSSREINDELENRVLKEFRSAYKIPNNSYVIIEKYDEDWDSMKKEWRQTFVFYLYDNNDELILDGNGSYLVINAEVEPDKEYPSLLNFKGTLIDVAFDIELALERLVGDE